MVSPRSWGAAGAASVLALVCAIAAQGARGRGGLDRLHVLLWALSGLAILAPLCPVPEAFLDALCPACLGWDALPMALVPPVDGRVLHRAPGAGAFEALRWGGLAAFAAAALLRAATLGGRIRLVRAALLTAVVAAASAGVSELLGFRLNWMGDTSPRWPGGPVQPLTNSNHWGALLSMGLLLGADLCWRARRRPWRLLARGVVTLALGAALLVSGSRGGVLAVAPGALWLLLGMTRRRPWMQRGSLAILAVIVIGAGVAWAVARELDGDQDPLRAGMTMFSENIRLGLWRDGLGVLAAHPWTGIGRGALADVLPGTQTVSSLARFIWLENIVLETLVDHGLPLGGCLLALGVGTLVRATRGALAAEQRGAGAALLTLATHELGDFALQTGVIAFTGLLLLAAVTARPRRTPCRPWLWVPLALTLAGAFGAAWFHRESLTDKMILSRLEQADTSEKVAAEADLALRDHPGSFPIAIELAHAQLRLGRLGPALTWLNRAQELAPRHGWPHLHAARILRAAGAESQALGEYRLAMEETPPLSGMIPLVLDETLSELRRDDLLERMVPSTPPGAAALMTWLAWSRGDHRAIELARSFGSVEPADPWTLLLAVRLAVIDGDRAGAEALAAAGPGQIAVEDYHRFYVGRLLAEVGAVEAAGAWLLSVEAAGGRRSAEASLELSRLALLRGDLAGARISQRRALAGPPAVRGATLLVRARIELAAGDTDGAIRACLQAQGAAGSEPEATLLLANLYAGRGDVVSAARALERAQAIHEDPRLQAALDALSGAPGGAQ